MAATHSSIDVSELHEHLLTLSHWWLENVLTQDDTAFVGEISSTGEKHHQANKSVILSTRLLWFFSEAAVVLNTKTQSTSVNHQALIGELRDAANVVYAFITRHFIDDNHGGVFWEVDYQGNKVNGRKQIYAQSFAIYALAAYYKLTKEPVVLDQATSIFDLIERYSADPIHGGYHEAFSQQWQTLDDVRLSSKDLNSKKTMNTHLHILEAYTALYKVCGEKLLKQKLEALMETFVTRFFDTQSQHLNMFLSENWVNESTHFSFGHDIESSWLIWEAATALGDEKLLQRYRRVVLDLAKLCAEQGMNSDGSLVDMRDIGTAKDSSDRIWWVQAEAMVGFQNAFMLKPESHYQQKALALWRFIQTEIIDHEHGEWHAVARSDQVDDYAEYKVGFWKGPYHNGRALIEMISRPA